MVGKKLLLTTYGISQNGQEVNRFNCSTGEHIILYSNGVLYWNNRHDGNTSYEYRIDGNMLYITQTSGKVTQDRWFELVGVDVEFHSVRGGHMGGRHLEGMVPRAENQPALRLHLRPEPLVAQHRPLLVVVELPRDYRERHVDHIGDALEVGPHARIPVGVGVVGVGDPVAVVLELLPEYVHVRLDLGAVEIESVVILARGLAGLPLRLHYVLLGVVDGPAGHDVLPEEAAAEAGDVPVHPVVAQIHALDLVGYRIAHEPSGQRGVGRAENAYVAAPRLLREPLVECDAVGPFVHVRREEAL